MAHSNLKRKAEDLLIVPVKKIHFQGAYLRQNWSLPDTLIFHVTKNPKSSTGYQKMVQSCKYFFTKNPIIVVDELCYDNDGKEKGWKISFDIFEEYICDPKRFKKFWIIDILECKSETNLFSCIIPQIYQADIDLLFLRYQTISLNEFLFISSKAESIYLSYTIIKNADNVIISIEEFFKVLLKAKHFYFFNKANASSITKNTVKELVKITNFLNVTNFQLVDPTELFDIKAFFNHIKAYKMKFTIEINYYETLSPAYKNLLDVITNEIIQTEKHEYRPPKIVYLDMGREKLEKMHKLSDEYE